MARLSSIKTLAGFDFSFQPSLDKNRIMALAELEFIDRSFLAVRLPARQRIRSPDSRLDAIAVINRPISVSDVGSGVTQKERDSNIG